MLRKLHSAVVGRGINLVLCIAIIFSSTPITLSPSGLASSHGTTRFHWPEINIISSAGGTFATVRRPVSSSPARIQAAQLDTDSSSIAYLDEQPVLFADNEGNATAHEYDDHVRLIDDKDALGKSITYEYDDDNNVIRSVDRGGHPTVHTYDSRGNMLTRQDALSGTVTFHYDAQNDVTYKRDEAGAETIHEYGQHGNLTHTLDGEGRNTWFTYHSRGLMQTARDANRSLTQFTYNSQGSLQTTKDALHNITRFEKETQLDHTGAREYDPTAGIWLTQDTHRGQWRTNTQYEIRPAKERLLRQRLAAKRKANDVNKALAEKLMKTGYNKIGPSDNCFLYVRAQRNAMGQATPEWRSAAEIISWIKEFPEMDVPPTYIIGGWWKKNHEKHPDVKTTEQMAKLYNEANPSQNLSANQFFKVGRGKPTVVGAIMLEIQEVSNRLNNNNVGHVSLVDRIDDTYCENGWHIREANYPYGQYHQTCVYASMMEPYFLY